MQVTDQPRQTHEPRAWSDCDNDPVIPRFPRPRKPQAAALAGIYMAAAEADHLAHCARWRALDEEFKGRYGEYGASTARRDRIQLGLHTARTTAVTA
jgi:hypothetical protein